MVLGSDVWKGPNSVDRKCADGSWAGNYVVESSTFLLGVVENHDRGYDELWNWDSWVEDLRANKDYSSWQISGNMAVRLEYFR